MARPTQAAQKTRALDRAGYAVATGLGAGFAPVAPGTFGAIEGVGLYLAVAATGLNSSRLFAALAVLNVAVFGLGVWASARACRISELEDPSQVVIDEVSGQLIALTPLAYALPVINGAGILLAFVLFRLFDIFKPYPIRRLERLHGGLGVMADDALAGVYAGLLVWLAIRFGLV
jgi:phosphatidylglycerophosphatase A